MIIVNLTVVEMRIIRSALTSEWYNAKDEGRKSLQQRITKLEEKLAEAESEGAE